MDSSIYLNSALSAGMNLPYDNVGRAFSIGRDFVLGRMEQDQGLDEHHRQVFAGIRPGASMRIEGTGFGWWNIYKPDPELELIVDKFLASTSFCRVDS